MLNDVFQNTVRFIFLVLFQVLILNNVELSGFLNPFLYVLFVLMLPLNTPNWLGLILGFVLGISIDMFSDTGGMHAAATVFLAFMRPVVLRLISPRDGYDLIRMPTIQQFGMNWFLSYAGILVLLHHLLLFYLEVFRFTDFFYTFLRVLLSSSFTLLLVFVSQFFFFRPSSK